MRNILKFSYGVLGLLFLATVAGYHYGPLLGDDSIKDLSLNLGTEIIGIFLTVFLIDAVIRRNEERERLRVRKVAMQQLRLPLVLQLQVLHGMYKTAIQHAPEILPTEVRNLFTKDYFAQIAFLDLSKPAPLWGITPLDWMDYLQSESQKFKTSLSLTLEKYAVFLDGDTVELLENILSSHLLAFFQSITAVRELDRKEGFRRKYNFFAAPGMVEMAREYTTLFTALITIFNQNSPSGRNIRLDLGFWRNDISPQIGSSRIEADET